MSVAVAMREESGPLDRAGEPPLAVEIVEGREAFNSLEKEWNAALPRGPRDEPMLRHEWVRAWIENFAPGAPLRVALARAGRELHAAVPLLEEKERNADTCFVPLTTWGTPHNDHSQRGGILLGRRGKEALPALWDKLAGLSGWDRLRLRDLPHGAPEWKLRDLAESAGFPCGLWTSLRSPYLLLPATEPAIATVEASTPASRQPPAAGRTKAAGRYEKVESRLDAKFRQNLRRRRRRLAEQGPVEYVVVDGKDAKQLDCALADFFVVEASGWKGRSGTAIAQRPELVGFYTQMARDAARRGALALGFLELAGRRIAAHLSLVHAGRHYLLKLGYDESLHELSPGQQLTSEMIRDSCQRGLAEFDFLGPCMDWKLDWEPALRTHTWLTIFRPTVAGRLVHEARYTAWPVARALARQVRLWGTRASGGHHQGASGGHHQDGVPSTMGVAG
ncbi:MAG: GNAT family N-acetyltransferase [Myxococcales bacterium]